MKLAGLTLLLMLALAPGASRAAQLFDPEDGMLDMSQYLQDNPYGFFAGAGDDYRTGYRLRRRSVWFISAW